MMRAILGGFMEGDLEEIEGLQYCCEQQPALQRSLHTQDDGLWS